MGIEERMEQGKGHERVRRAVNEDGNGIREGGGKKQHIKGCRCASSWHNVSEQVVSVFVSGSISIYKLRETAECNGYVFQCVSLFSHTHCKQDQLLAERERKEGGGE